MKTKVIIAIVALTLIIASVFAVNQFYIEKNAKEEPRNKILEVEYWNFGMHEDYNYYNTEPFYSKIRVKLYVVNLPNSRLNQDASLCVKPFNATKHMCWTHWKNEFYLSIYVHEEDLEFEFVESDGGFIGEIIGSGDFYKDETYFLCVNWGNHNTCDNPHIQVANTTITVK